MTQLSKERLETIAAWREKYGENHNVMLPAAEAQEMARRLLAAEAREPVRYLNKFTGVCITLEQQPDAATDTAVYVPLFDAPQPVAVPDELVELLISAIEKEQEPLFGEDYLMDSKDCVDVIREESQRVNARRAAAQPSSGALQLPDGLPPMEHLDIIKFNADCAMENPDSIYANEFFLSLDEIFGEKGNYSLPVQAKAISVLIAEIFRIHGYKSAPQEPTK